MWKIQGRTAASDHRCERRGGTSPRKAFLGLVNQPCKPRYDVNRSVNRLEVSTVPLAREEMRAYQRQRRARLAALAMDDDREDVARRTAVLTVHLAPAEVGHLRGLADAAGVTVSAYARAAIRGRLAVER